MFLCQLKSWIFFTYLCLCKTNLDQPDNCCSSNLRFFACFFEWSKQTNAKEWQSLISFYNGCGSGYCALAKLSMAWPKLNYTCWIAQWVIIAVSAFVMRILEGLLCLLSFVTWLHILYDMLQQDKAQDKNDNKENSMISQKGSHYWSQPSGEKWLCCVRCCWFLGYWFLSIHHNRSQCKECATISATKMTQTILTNTKQTSLQLLYLSNGCKNCGM